MQRACSIFSSVVCPGLQYFSILSQKDKIFEEKKVTEYKMCFGFLYDVGLEHFLFQEELSEI